MTYQTGSNNMPLYEWLKERLKEFNHDKRFSRSEMTGALKFLKFIDSYIKREVEQD